ncbi:Cuticle-degrading protease [Tolypocladium ophioglossoides CBS 100239]|uniref:Cuticle-degrading protease n=1 Tax=Tolypocladium ophioglossoides (strain CBS 100239) TaxID=1163406 RepID=A0A0L0NKQ9_TOLOC|nr:Cuticle-degrading protease [Tolypocladium ophioglossoides CBS 100239]
MKLSAILSILPAVLAVPTPAARRAEPAPLLTPRGRADQLIANKYIVKFKDGMSASSVDDAVHALSNKADHVYDLAFRGFAGHLSAEELKTLRNRPDVEYIEQDAIATQSDGLQDYIQQANATWGLSRISHRKAGGSTYGYHKTAGEGTCAYIIDTGIEHTHPEFQGRAKMLRSFARDQRTDGNGHGTHCAGIIGSKTYGVAKKAKLFGVKVLDDEGSGSYAGVIAGMQFVMREAPKHKCPRGVVANMSLGGPKSAAVNAAAAAMIEANIFVAVAAGNEDADARGASPASEPTVCTVGATNSADQRSDFSNFGPAVDIFAPGESILSTWLGGTTLSISGTSMASPHIAGLAAHLLAVDGFDEPQKLRTKMQKLATANVLKNMREDTVNLLAFNGQPAA